MFENNKNVERAYQTIEIFIFNYKMDIFQISFVTNIFSARQRLIFICDKKHLHSKEKCKPQIVEYILQVVNRK